MENNKKLYGKHIHFPYSLPAQVDSIEYWMITG